MGKMLEMAFDGLYRDLRHVQIVMFRDGFQFFAKLEGQFERPGDADGAATASIQ
jgi:hypothetical protein